MAGSWTALGETGPWLLSSTIPDRSSPTPSPVSDDGDGGDDGDSADDEADLDFWRKLARGGPNAVSDPEAKTVSVPVLDDVIDEGEETFTLRLSNATGARIADAEATGTVSNGDPLQKMWLSRFGRTVADHVMDAVAGRLSAPLAGAQITLAGQSVDLSRTGDSAVLVDARFRHTLLAGRRVTTPGAHTAIAATTRIRIAGTTASRRPEPRSRARAA